MDNELKAKMLRLLGDAIGNLTYIVSCNVSGGKYKYIVNSDHQLRELRELIQGVDNE